MDFIHLTENLSSSGNIADKIYEDEQGNIWVGTYDGLFIMRKGDLKFIKLEFTGSIQHVKLDYIVDILQWNEDSFYIVGSESYLMTNVKKALNGTVPEGSVIRFENLPLPQGYAPFCLYKDRSRNIYIGTVLNTYRIHKNSPKSGFLLEPMYVNSIVEGENKTYKHVHQIMEDRTGILWTVNYFYGIFKYNLHHPKFKSFKKEINTYFTNTDINQLICDTEGNIWIGVFGGGLYKIHKTTNQVIRYDLGQPGQINNYVITFTEISPGRLLIGLNGGIEEFDTHTGIGIDPLPAGKTARNLRSSEVYDILKDGEYIYMATTNGMFVLDRVRDKLYQYSFTRDDSSSDTRNRVLSPIQMANGDIWFASSHYGINRIVFNGKTEEISISSIVADSILELNNIHLEGRYRIYKAVNGSIWIINNAGLHRLHPDFKMADHFKLFHNVEFPEVWSIQEDSNGNLWMGSQYGLCVFNAKTEQIITYGTKDGLPVTLHGYNTTFRDRDGRIYFGGMGGFYSFYPDSIVSNHFIPPVVITQFSIFKKIIQVSSDRKAILTRNISYTQRIDLKYNQNDVSFTFAALDYTNPAQNRYAYKLEGYQDEWIETAANNRLATYTNLSPGEYVFRVKGSNNDGFWNEEGATVTITIHPPFWKTYLAYILYGVFFLLLLRGYIYWRTNQLRREKQFLEKEIKERTFRIEEQKTALKEANAKLEVRQNEIEEVNTLLVDQKEQLIQQKEELQSTLENLKRTQEQLIESEKMAAIGGLVAGVSHEMNTPISIGVTAISCLLEDVQKMKSLYGNGVINQKDFLGFLGSTMDTAKLIEKNLERAASLIQSFKQVSVDQVTEQLRIFILKDYLNDILLSLRPKFREKKIEFKILCDDDLQLQSYPGVYAQIFTNLLINSFQHGFHIREKGVVLIQAEILNEMLRIQYSDDGEGISKKHLPHIFEPFYTSDQHPGTGLGLNIVYNLVTQKLHGKISCSSEPGKGVLFTIDVPV